MINDDMTMDEIRAVYYRRLEEYSIPAYMQERLVEYICVGQPVGDFLWNLLSNDLRGTFERADENNKQVIDQYVGFLYSVAPAGCWGNVGNVHSWRMEEGLFGRQRKSRMQRGEREGD